MKAYAEEGDVLPCKPLKRSAGSAPREIYAFDCPYHEGSLTEGN